MTKVAMRVLFLAFALIILAISARVSWKIFQGDFEPKEKKEKRTERTEIQEAIYKLNYHIGHTRLDQCEMKMSEEGTVLENEKSMRIKIYNKEEREAYVYTCALKDVEFVFQQLGSCLLQCKAKETCINDTKKNILVEKTIVSYCGIYTEDWVNKANMLIDECVKLTK